MNRCLIVILLLSVVAACATPRHDTPRSLRAEIARARVDSQHVRSMAAGLLDEDDRRTRGSRVDSDEQEPRVDDANLSSWVEASPYRGKVVRLSGRLRLASNAADGSSVRLWLRVVRPDGRPSLFDDMLECPVRSQDGVSAEIVGAIDSDAERIEFGVAMEGLGPFHVGDVVLEAVRDTTPNDPPLATRLSQRQLENRDVQTVRLRSDLLSRFWGRDIFMEAGVVPPPDVKDGESLAISYEIPGFGGSWTDAYSEGALLANGMRNGYPRLLYVFLDPMCTQGHHAFVDSVNTGPWGEALVSELIPAIETRFFAGRAPKARYLTGHASGGWSSLWLQVAYPHLFDGAWATAPDSIDFRDFCGVDIYSAGNLYYDAKGDEVPFVRDGGEWVSTLRAYARDEFAADAIGGPIASHDAAFGPRGDDGRPMPLFDRKTGAIDPFVAQSWRKHDLSAILRERWSTLGPKLVDKLHVWCGELDTFGSDGSVRRFSTDLDALGVKLDILVVPGRDHFDLGEPDPVLWPYGMRTRIHREMAARAAGFPRP